MAAHPGNDYYVNLITGSIQRQSNPIAAQALQVAGYAGPFDWATAQDVAKNHSGILAASPAASAGTNTGAIGQVQQAVGGSAGIADFLSRLTQKNTWVRVAEVAIGIILIAVGVARMTHAVPIATKIAGAVA